MNFSVLISVYYKEKPEYLKDAINSIFNQTRLPNEVILVEDGKLTDELYNTIKRLREKYNGIKEKTVARISDCLFALSKFIIDTLLPGESK